MYNMKDIEVHLHLGMKLRHLIIQIDTQKLPQQQQNMTLLYSPHNMY